VEKAAGWLNYLDNGGGGIELNERYKIGEAKFFLARMEESFHDRETFRYYLSAFLTAARSVIQYAREESRSKGRQQWYEETIAGNNILSHGSQTTVRNRFADWPETGDRVGSSKRYSKDLISLSHRYIEELEKFVQRGIGEGILSG
jgi:hypothetical protein